MDDARAARIARPPVGLTNNCHKRFDRSQQTWQEASATKTRSTYYRLLLQEHENYEAV